MIFGCKGWNDKTGYFRQDNNFIEAFLKSYGVEQFYATCFPTSVCRAVSAVRGEDNFKIKSAGGWSMQPEDYLTGFMNDPENRPAFDKIRKDPDCLVMPENQIPQYYPYALWECFKEKCTFEWGGSMEVLNLLKEKHAVVVLQKRGHAVCVVAFDESANEFIYDDPLYGFNLRVDLSMYDMEYESAMVIV